MKIKIISLLCLSLCFGPGSESQSESHEGPKLGQFYKRGDVDALVLPVYEWTEDIRIVLSGPFSREPFSAQDRFGHLFYEYEVPTFRYLIHVLNSNIIETFISAINKCSIQIYQDNFRVEYRLIRSDSVENNKDICRIIDQIADALLDMGKVVMIRIPSLKRTSKRSIKIGLIKSQQSQIHGDLKGLL